MGVDPEAGWEEWLARWERFQAAYVPDRDDQFAAIARYALADAPAAARVLDLAAGPGSLAAALRAVALESSILALDTDPFLAELGRRASPAARHICWRLVDLRRAGWPAEAGSEELDAAVCAQALHWFDDDELHRLYRGTATLLRPGAAFVIADVIPQGTFGVQAAGRGMLERAQAGALGAGGESWPEFWRAVEAEPAFASLCAARHQLLGPRRPRVLPPLEFHLQALREAGFRDAGEVWRRDACAVVLAIR